MFARDSRIKGTPGKIFERNSIKTFQNTFADTLERFIFRSTDVILGGIAD